MVVRYKDDVFTEVSVRSNISYALHEHPGSKDRDYLLDLYQPAGDAQTDRPLILWMHGGGFKFGSKNARGIEQWSRQFAKKGYVCAGLNYPLSKKNPLFHFDELRRSCYYAVNGIDEAITYFKQHWKEYGIDTNRIILAGNSAGGMIALQSVYPSRRQLAELCGLPGEGLSTVHNPQHVAAVINFWGGLFRIGWLDEATVPVFSAYGTRDKIVTPNSTDTSLYGSIAIHERADRLRIPNRIKVYEGYSHELQKHFNPIFPPGEGTRKRWESAGRAAADFLVSSVFTVR